MKVLHHHASVLLHRQSWMFTRCSDENKKEFFVAINSLDTRHHPAILVHTFFAVYQSETLLIWIFVSLSASKSKIHEGDIKTFYHQQWKVKYEVQTSDARKLDHDKIMTNWKQKHDVEKRNALTTEVKWLYFESFWRKCWQESQVNLSHESFSVKFNHFQSMLSTMNKKFGYQCYLLASLKVCFLLAVKIHFCRKLLWRMRRLSDKIS